MGATPAGWSPSGHSSSPSSASSALLSRPRLPLFAGVVQELRAVPLALMFHVVNAVLGAAGFALILGGLALSLGLLALCCVGVLVFRLLLALAPLLVQADVMLHNFAAPPDRRLCERQADLSESLFLQRRAALLSAVYLATAKLGMGVLSALVVALPVALPINALTSASFRDTYLRSGAAGYTEIVAVSLVLLVAGVAAMPHVARVSCATTRYFCCEALCTHTYFDAPDAPPPTAEQRAKHTYGTR